MAGKSAVGVGLRKGTSVLVGAIVGKAKEAVGFGWVEDMGEGATEAGRLSLHALRRGEISRQLTTNIAFQRFPLGVRRRIIKCNGSAFLCISDGAEGRMGRPICMCPFQAVSFRQFTHDNRAWLVAKIPDIKIIENNHQPRCIGCAGIKSKRALIKRKIIHLI